MTLVETLWLLLLLLLSVCVVGGDRLAEATGGGNRPGDRECGQGGGSRRDRAVGGDSCGDTLATAGAAVRVVSGDRLTEVSG